MVQCNILPKKNNLKSQLKMTEEQYDLVCWWSSQMASCPSCSNNCIIADHPIIKSHYAIQFSIIRCIDVFGEIFLCLNNMWRFGCWNGPEKKSCCNSWQDMTLPIAPPKKKVIKKNWANNFSSILSFVLSQCKKSFNQLDVCFVSLHD